MGEESYYIHAGYEDLLLLFSKLIAQRLTERMSRDIWTPEIFVPPERIFHKCCMKLIIPLEIWVPPALLWGVCASMSAVPGPVLGANKMARWSARCHYIPQDEFG